MLWPSKKDHVEFSVLDLAEECSVSVIIRSYNEEKYIGECLSALRAQKFEYPVEIIVVDSGSTDTTCQIAINSECNLVNIPKQLFTYGYALNIGAAQANGNILVALSAHCIPKTNNWLDCLVRPIIEKRADLTFGSHSADPNARSSEFNFFSRKYCEAISRNNCANYFNNGNSAFTKKHWLERGFDSDLSAQEDIDFAKFHTSRGALIEYASAAAVIHYHNFSNKLLYNRIVLDTEANFRLGSQSLLLLIRDLSMIPVWMIKDAYLAWLRGRLFSAVPGIFCFRMIEAFASVVGCLKSMSV